MTEKWVHISSGNSLLPALTKPLPEPMLIYAPLPSTGGQFHKNFCHQYKILNDVTWQTYSKSLRATEIVTKIMSDFVGRNQSTNYPRASLQRYLLGNILLTCIHFDASMVWIINHTYWKMWDEATYPSGNLNSAIVEVWTWISNLLPHFIGHGSIHPCWC